MSRRNQEARKAWPLFGLGPDEHLKKRITECKGGQFKGAHLHELLS
jgi:hypothetical protein